ncbi:MULTISPECIES: FMN-dependent NADH-azoreductase [Pseudomonas]|jgi:FMN-dependent NADH-azoreductase|uniref:FMN-dependent NADH-azoreductase n=1 Tax=Pseudomonas TaxID=286 RepID=UPI0010FA8ED7|nr:MULTISPECIES: NAD(P)H-dependent oxidoreductase [Pseudomonas]MBP1138557.1 FMN-dependent NADH-azoreductase [Pseudomonas sp. PvP009]QVK31691.1 NAD(P)H-dependent oxidoreductase [Pseudomonas syringae]
MHILHIASSPRAERSVSLKLASRYLETFTSLHPESTVDALDVWTTDLLPFDGPALNAKYADLQGVQMSAEQQAVWKQIHALGERFHRADVILFSVPMWNFGIPYRLKHLIDAVSQRGVLFEFDAQGMRGLLKGKKVVVFASRGVALGEDFPTEAYDHQVAYLRTWARMVGIPAIDAMLSEATLADPATAEANFNAALAEASKLATDHSDPQGAWVT